MTNAFIYQPKRHIAIIESARGFAALYVLMMHVVILPGLPTSLSEDSYARLGVDLLLLYGHQAVLLFFVLSGFSIHYASVDHPLNHRPGILHYYYLRWRRIYPDYLQVNKRYGIIGCIAFGILLSIASFSIGKIFGAQNVLSLYVIWCLGAVLAVCTGIMRPAREKK